MNKNKNLVSANQLVFGDEFRPANDKRYENTWMRVIGAATNGMGRTYIQYEIPGSDVPPHIMHTNGLATMEVR